MKRLPAILVAMGLGLVTAVASADQAKPKSSREAADFPPGSFSDSNYYSLSDLHGKVVVLFFYENSCPTCRGTIPDRNKLVAQYADKPVKFIAVGPHDSLADVKEYIAETGLVMPTFADPFKVMEKRYGFVISLNDIYQFRVIGTDGALAGFGPLNAVIDRSLEKAHWTFKDDNYHPKLAAIVDAFEWNQWTKGMAALKVALNSSDSQVKASAQKLFEAVKKQGQGWKDEADKEAESEPLKAFDLYLRVTQVFAGDDLGKSVAAPLKKIEQKKEVMTEMDARRGYAQLEAALAKATLIQKEDVVKFCQNFVKKYPDAAITAKVQAYLDDLTN